MSRNNQAIVYTDGACSNNGRDNSSAGIGVYFDGRPDLNVSEPISGNQTNNRAELQAAARGIETAHANGYDKVVIRSDSKHVVDGATKWIPNWNQNGWRSDIKNAPEFRQLESAARAHGNVEFQYIPRAQNKADSLAKQGSRR